MPEKNFRVRVYEIEYDSDTRDPERDLFLDAIAAAEAADVAQRTKEVGGRLRRLEHHRDEGGVRLLNFVTAEYSGPGRTEPLKPTEAINLAPEEFFSYETAMAYNPDSGLLLLESGVIGMRPSSVAGYFREFDTTTYFQLRLKIDPEASAKARRFQEINKVTARVSMGPASISDTEAGVGVIRSLGSEYGAKSMDLVLTVGRERKNSLEIGKVRPWIERVLGPREDTNIEQLKVRGREHEDETMDEIDLLLQPIQSERVLPVDSGMRNVPHEVRWNALMEMLREIDQ